MTDDELCTVGQTTLTALRQSCDTPGDAISVLVYLILMLYQLNPDAMPFEAFMDSFKEHCIKTYAQNTTEQPREYRVQ